MHHTLARVLAATGCFLVAVLWMDLMYDAAYFRGAPDAMVTITAYYRHVTLEAGWMTWLIALVMVVTLVAVVLQARRSTAHVWRRAVVVALALVPITLAMAVVFPAARGLAHASDATRLEHVRLIAWSHVGCLASMGAFVGVQLRGPSERA